jgi:hypothetical protein
MKIVYATLSLILLLLSGNIIAQKAFEGKVVFNVEENGAKQVMDYYAKDKKFRMEVPDQGGYIIFDSKASKMYIVMDEQKMYMETALDASNTTASAGNINKTGETKKILGYDCEKFLFEQDGSKGESWMTKELGAFMFFTESQQGMADWQKEILNEGYFPLQVIEYDNSGNVESTYLVTEVTPKELSSDMFAIPASYQKLDMSNMGNMKNMMGK